jgi:hypothetical protein
LQHGLLPVVTTGNKKYQAVYVAAAGNNTPEKSEVAPVPVPDAGGLYDSSIVETSLASALCHELDQCVAKGSDHAWAEACSAPTSIALLMDYIVCQFEHRRPKSTKLPTNVSFLSARNRYHTFFPPETCIFSFQNASTIHSVHIIMQLQGRRFFFWIGSLAILR